ncbi:MAG: bifunctional diaminohydroxyphosphoribosylaminopyrimidine deaminase/5-amino-6-(5-phosphoribosylamino)uracil reductase RibD [Woeseiaceae bacterium]
MPEFSKPESAFMQRAVQLAGNGQFSAHPNPMVGCVLVKDGEIVGEGWHEIAGEPHAEINALQSAGKKANGATAFVTLEPCAHHGKTPPCTDALIAAGVKEVVFARQDPNPKVDGKGMQALDGAGIVVRAGLMQQEVDELLAGFLSRVMHGRPRVRLKIACSIDGRIAMADGHSQWITGEEARADVQRLRGRSGAVMTGVGTVLADDPSLTVRDATFNPHDRQPLRVILDSGLRTPPAARLLSQPGETLIFCCDDQESRALTNAGAEVVQLKSAATVVDLNAVLKELGRRQINDLLVEAGPTVAGRLLEQGLIDELVIYQAPHIMGSETMGMFETPKWTQLADRQALQIMDVTQIGNDTRITARPAN